MEQAQQEQVKGTYLYAIVPASLVPEIQGLLGVEGGKVSAITEGDLAAVISEVPTREELRPERRLLSAHQDVLKQLLDLSSVVLPVSFGTVAESPQGIRDLLKKYQQEFSKQMKKVEGKVEMRVRVSYDTEKPNIYEFLVASSPELKELRDRIAKKGGQATREEKIDLGQKFDAVLTMVRDQNTEKIEKVLGKLGEIRRNPPHNEKELVNIACLIPKTKVRDFGPAMDEATRLFPDSFALQEFGPFPPYDFVEVHVKS